MNQEVYIRDQNILVKRLKYYIIFTLIEEAFFALATQYTPIEVNDPRILIRPFSVIMAKFVFMAYALINKNIYQIMAYLPLILFAIKMVCIRFLKPTKLGVIFSICTIFTLILDGSYTVFLIYKLKDSYLWYFYKKLGLSEELQYVNKLKQILSVFFRLDIFMAVTSLEFPITSMGSIKFTNYIGYALTFFSAFFYTQWQDEENTCLRIATILLVIMKLAILLWDLVKIVSHLSFYFNIFICSSLIYSSVNDILYIIYLCLDLRTYGNNYSAELLKNVRLNRAALTTASNHRN